ncbi:MAG: HNH endonuclease [Luteolibacter sp.]
MKICSNYLGYCVSDDGKQVYSFRRRKKSLRLSKFTSKKGYFTVSVVDPVTGKSRPVGLHQLVADAFHGKCPENMQVRHLNGNPSDNRPENLIDTRKKSDAGNLTTTEENSSLYYAIINKYGTVLDNANDRKKHGRYASGANHHNSKPKNYQFTGTKTDQVKQIGNAVPRRLARALVAAVLSQNEDVSALVDAEEGSEAVA